MMWLIMQPKCRPKTLTWMPNNYQKHNNPVVIKYIINESKNYPTFDVMNCIMQRDTFTYRRYGKDFFKQFAACEGTVENHCFLRPCA